MILLGSARNGSARREHDVIDETCLDGNAIAGLLQELLGAEVTDAPRGCHSCGKVHPIGAHRLYRGAGLVLRCPSCGVLAARIVLAPGRHVVELAGSWRLQIPVYVSPDPTSPLWRNQA
jgi:hypothetical protein